MSETTPASTPDGPDDSIMAAELRADLERIGSSLVALLARTRALLSEWALSPLFLTDFLVECQSVADGGDPEHLVDWYEDVEQAVADAVNRTGR